MTLRKTVLAATLAVAGIAFTADRASAQYYNYNYAVTPYGGYYNSYAVAPTYSYGYNPYVGYGTFNAAPTYAYRYNYYSTPFYNGGYRPLNYGYNYNAGYRPFGYGYRGRW